MATLKNNINAAVFTALKVSEGTKVPVLIMSNPGLGKTTSVKLFADIRGYHYQLLRGNSTSAEEVLGYDVAKESERATVHLRPAWFSKILEKHKEGKKSLLFLDEITTANEYVQAALLHLVFERMVGDEPLPEDTLIVSAGNYAQNLSNTMNMIPPLMNRFMIFNIIPNIKDLDVFLNKYDGASVKKNYEDFSYLKSLSKYLTEIDDQEIDITPSALSIAGEYIEKGIKEATKFLINSGNRPLDLSVTELQNIYSDTDNDSKLYGFITFRTLNYLRDVSLEMYRCFGKPGLLSNNYKNMIDGLVGIAVSRNSNGEIVNTKVGKTYFDQMALVVNDLEKLSNDDISRYNEQMRNILTRSKKLDIPAVTLLKNTLNEVKNNSSLSDVERPLDEGLMIDVFKSIKKTSGKIASFGEISATDDILVKITVEKMTGEVVMWNSLCELMGTAYTVLSSVGFNYSETTISACEELINDTGKIGSRLRGYRALFVIEDEAAASLIPDIKSVPDLFTLHI